MGTRHSIWHGGQCGLVEAVPSVHKTRSPRFLLRAQEQTSSPQGRVQETPESVSQAPELPGCKKTELIAIISSCCSEQESLLQAWLHPGIQMAQQGLSLSLGSAFLHLQAGAPLVVVGWPPASLGRLKAM